MNHSSGAAVLLSHSFNFDQRRRPDSLRTAMATAFFCPTSTTSRLHTRDLSEDRVRVIDEAKDGDRRHDVELFGWERKMLGHRHLKGDIRIVPFRPAFGCIDHLSGCIDAHHSRAAFREFEGKLSIATAYIEDSVAANIADEFEDQLAFEPLGSGTDLGGAPSGVDFRSQVGNAQAG
jgi:hypothetical protein